MLVPSTSSSAPAGGVRVETGRSQSEPCVPLTLYTDIVRENERLRLELESLRSSVSRRVEGEEAVLSIGSPAVART